MTASTNTYLTISLLVLIAAGLIFAKANQAPETQIQPTPSATPVAISNTQVKGIMDVDQLIIEDIATGSGAKVKAGDTVVMHYTGTLLDGTKFDSSVDRSTPFETQIGVGQVIQGWDQGVPGMQVGGKRKLTIPSALGYGPNGIPGAIPGAAALVFEVELLEIK